MSNRIANIIVLTEDEEQQNLIRRYLLLCGHDRRSFRLQPLPASKGCGSQYVRSQFPAQVAATRAIVGRRTKCLLIVMIDADHEEVEARKRALATGLAQAGGRVVATDEAIVVFVPKWQVETWIKCLLGEVCKEDDRYTDQPMVNADQIRAAAEVLYQWARPNAQLGLSCVPSLRAALPDWLRIG